MGAKFTDEELTNYIVYLFDHVINNGMIPGKIENFVVIVDTKDVWATQISIKRLKPLINTLKVCYRGRLFKFFCVNTGMMLRAIWKLLKGFVEESTQKQMSIYGGKFQKDLLELVSEDNLEAKYGGKQPDKVDNFFPPDLK